MRSLFALLGLSLLCSLPGCTQEPTDRGDAPVSRSFRLDYGATLTGIPQGSRVRVWLPVPPSNEHQEVEALEADLPAKAETATESTYGNKILHFEVAGPASGEIAFRTSYRVDRHEVHGLSDKGRTELTEEQRKLFLAANAKVPLEGKPLDLLAETQIPDDSLAMARMLYNRVDDHVAYDKSRPGYGNGDVLWVCDSRFGNCTDFHSLFISLSRAKGLPARFEIGFPLPPERGQGTIGGYHCWALFHSEEKGWVPVDISEADKHPDMKHYYFGNLTENRVTFTTGRDLQLVPPQQGAPLNFFVYPYIEVNGEPWPKEKVKFAFAYTDLP